jgi:hypothetical protein
MRVASIALLLGLAVMLSGISQITHAAMYAFPAAHGSPLAAVGQGVEPDRAAHSRHANTAPEFQKREAVRLDAAPAPCLSARYSASQSFAFNGSVGIGTTSPSSPLNVVTCVLDW